MSDMCGSVRCLVLDLDMDLRRSVGCAMRGMARETPLVRMAGLERAAWQVADLGSWADKG